MAKKYYKLEYLESFIGKEYISFDGRCHIRVIGISNNKFAKNTFDTQLETNAVDTSISLKNERNGLVNVGYLLDKTKYLEKTPALMVLYGQIKKEPQP